jgi:hypothetical protein
MSHADLDSNSTPHVSHTLPESLEIAWVRIQLR